MCLPVLTCAIVTCVDERHVDILCFDYLDMYEVYPRSEESVLQKPLLWIIEAEKSKHLA